MTHIKLNRLFVFFFMLLLVGCASTSKPPIILDTSEPERTGVYHKVHRGETIWRIAKAYSTSINDIINANHIPNAAQVEENQLLFIPGAFTVKEIPEQTDDASEFVWPIKGKILNYFHERDGNRVNKGINIQGVEGAIVKSARGGAIVFADYLTGYGHTVIVDHNDGLHSVYAQNDKLFVKLGDSVNQGQDIAQLGLTKGVTYLHFQIRKNGVDDNPFYYLPRATF